MGTRTRDAQSTAVLHVGTLSMAIDADECIDFYLNYHSVGYLTMYDVFDSVGVVTNNVIYYSLLATPFKSNVVTLLITFWQQ